MPTWDIDINLRFTLTSDDIAAFPNWDNDMATYGPRRQIRAERQWLENMARRSPDFLIAYYLSRIDANNQLGLRDTSAAVASGVDGEFVVAGTEFRSSSVSLTPAMVGRIIHVTNVNNPAVVRGFYRINNRNGPNSVNCDGIFTQSATGLTFDIYDPSQAVLILTAETPV